MTMRITVAFGLIALLSLQGRPLRAQPTVISDLVEAKAVVESVNLNSRMVLLQDDKGDLETIIASPGGAQSWPRCIAATTSW